MVLYEEICIIWHRGSPKLFLSYRSFDRFGIRDHQWTHSKSFSQLLQVLAPSSGKGIGSKSLKAEKMAQKVRTLEQA